MQVPIVAPMYPTGMICGNYYIYWAYIYMTQLGNRHKLCRPMLFFAFYLKQKISVVGMPTKIPSQKYVEVFSCFQKSSKPWCYKNPHEVVSIYTKKSTWRWPSLSLALTSSQHRLVTTPHRMRESEHDSYDSWHVLPNVALPGSDFREIARWQDCKVDPKSRYLLNGANGQ